jgi:hypothetical protein
VQYVSLCQYLTFNRRRMITFLCRSMKCLYHPFPTITFNDSLWTNCFIPLIVLKANQFFAEFVPCIKSSAKDITWSLLRALPIEAKRMQYDTTTGSTSRNGETELIHSPVTFLQVTWVRIDSMLIVFFFIPRSFSIVSTIFCNVPQLTYLPFCSASSFAFR